MSVNDETVFVNKTTWVEVQRDDNAFLKLIGEILAILEAPVPPEASKGCPTCTYRSSMQEFEALQ